MMRWSVRPPRVFATSLALWLGACVGGSETGNPVSSELALSVHSTDKTIASVRGVETGARVDSAWVSIGEIEFERASECDLDLEEEIELPAQAVDLVQPSRDPGALGLPEDAFCRVEFELVARALPLPTGAPAELEGHTLVILGTTASGAPFEITTAMELELEVRSLGAPFTVSGTGESVIHFVLSFDAATWFAGIDLDAGVASPDGVIRVNDEQNGDLLDALESNLEGSADLVYDRNGNALRDEGESLD